MFLCLEENQKLHSKTQTSVWDYVPQRTCDKVSLVWTYGGEAELLLSKGIIAVAHFYSVLISNQLPL